MEQFDIILNESLDRYFNVLSKTGYVNSDNVDKLMLLIFLQEFLTECEYIITEEDYNLINSIINCLSDSSCLIPYRQFKQPSEPLVGYINNVLIRITEQDDERIVVQDGEIRLVNQ